MRVGQERRCQFDVVAGYEYNTVSTIRSQTQEHIHRQTRCPSWKGTFGDRGSLVPVQTLECSALAFATMPTFNILLLMAVHDSITYRRVDQPTTLSIGICRG